MYISYYQLAEPPFQNTTDPRFLWLGEKHKEALATLQYGVFEEKGFVLLTGDVGTGKTTLINALLQSIGEDIYVASLSDPGLDNLGFLNFISRSFHISGKFDRKEEFFISFENFLRKAHSEAKRVLLIVDEAHKLPEELLEQIRTLSNIELPETKLINILLIGQDELNQKLQSPFCRALRQRITLHYRLETLSKNETLQYIQHRLKVAGANKDLFNRKAVRLIHGFSDGYPRLINRICDHALLTGYVKEMPIITPKIIKECSREVLFAAEATTDPLSNFRKLRKAIPLFRHTNRFREQRVIAENIHSENADSQKEGADHGVRTNESITSNADAANVSIRVQENLILSLKKWAFLSISVGVFLAIFSAVILFLSYTGFFTQLNQKKLLVRGADTPASSSQKDRSVKLPEQGEAISPKPAVSSTEPTKEAGTGASQPHLLEEDHSQKLPEQGEAISPKPAVSSTEPTKEAGTDTSLSVLLDVVDNAIEKKNYQQAIESLEKAMKQSPENMLIYKKRYSQALLGQAVRVSEKDSNEAALLIRRAAESDPQNPEVYVELGKFHTRAKDYSSAINAYQKAAELTPSSADIIFNLGYLNAKLKNYERAEQMFLRVTEMSPSYLDRAFFNLAMVQLKQGKKQKSIENLKKTLTINPDNQMARKYLERLNGFQGGTQ